VSFLVLVMAAAVAGGDAPAAAPAPAANATASASDKPAPDPNKVVCRKEQVTGSRFWKRICMTQGEWDEQTAKAERNQAIINQRAGLGGAMGGGGYTGQ
jgi:hypothetical protein